jgi:hypothetical protein
MMAISCGSTFDRPVDKRPLETKKAPFGGTEGGFGVLAARYEVLKP